MRTARHTALALILLLDACSTHRLPERYAHCSDLGTLRLAAASANEAEDHMRAQVAIIGGDLLLFNGTGHAEDASAAPPALTQRRNVLAAPPAESPSGKQPELTALEASIGSATEMEQALWYYGVALRCGRDTSDQRSAVSGG
ncbi:MAG: hypothetical protein ACO1PZ_00785 [Gammaproteobacteria bacterium]